jgi:hypothetical protein
LSFSDTDLLVFAILIDGNHLLTSTLIGGLFFGALYAALDFRTALAAVAGEGNANLLHE